MFRSAIAFLIGFTGLSCLQVAFFPRLPAAAEPEVDLETMAGAQPLLMGELPGQQSRDWALSPTRRYGLRSQDEQQPSSDLDLLMTGATVRREEHLQVALITKGNPHLEMDRRRVYRTAAGDEYAIGMIGGREALQSCQVPSGRSGVTQETLAALMPVKPLQRQDLTVLLRRLAGVQPNRNYRCVLISVISPQKGQRDQLIAQWRKLQLASRDPSRTGRSRR